MNFWFIQIKPSKFQKWKVHMFTPFTPTIEAPQVKEPFLTRYPYHAAQAGSMYNVPLLVSVTSEEGLYPGAGKNLGNLNADQL